MNQIGFTNNLDLFRPVFRNADTFVYDHIGNVVAVVDSTGATIAAYEYDPFGNIIAQSASEADEVPFRFSTKYFDAETGLYYYGYRFYAPELGRWINRDPMEEDEGGANLLRFCDNSGICTTDTLGLFVFMLEFAQGDATIGEIDRRVFDVSKQITERAIRIVNRMPESVFRQAVEKTYIHFNKEVFTGTKSEYLQRLTRELESNHQLHTGALSLEKAKMYGRAIGEALKMCKYDYDSVVVAAHGEIRNTIPTGNVFLGTTTVPSASFFNPSIQNSHEYARYLLLVSCYQTWDPSKTSEETVENIRIALARIQTPPKYFEEADPSKGPPTTPIQRPCYLYYTPMKAIKTVGSQNE